MSTPITTPQEAIEAVRFALRYIGNAADQIEIDEVLSKLETRIAPPPAPSAVDVVTEAELRSMLSAFTEGLGPRRIQPTPAPSATAQRAAELLDADQFGGWETQDVRDFLREIGEEKP